VNDRVKYLLVVAGDRALTKFITETLLGRKLDKSGPHLRGNGWQIARAHSALEGLMVLTKSEQRIDAILVDQSLPDRDALSFLDRVRKEEAGSQIPLFVMTERGRDQLTRKLASDSYAVTGFIDKPVTAESLRRGLRNLERMRHVLIVEKNADIRAELEVECRRAGFSVDMMQTARAALSAVSQTRPDAVVIGLGLDDMPGADLCVQVKRSPTTHTVPVLLYGTVAELEAVDIAENAHRADDFLQAPIKGTALVQRILALVGRGVSRIAAPPEPPVLEIQPLTGTDSGIDNRRAGDIRSTQDLAKIKRPGNDHDTLESAVDLSAVTPRPNLPTAPPPPPKPPPPEEWSARQSSTRKNLGSIPRTSESQQELESQAMREMANDGRGNSPLSPPASASPSPSGSAKRSTRRVPCNLSVSFKDGATICQSTTLNISNGGILIATDHPIEIGTHIDLTLRLPDRPEPITAVGKVAWSSSAPSPGTTDGSGSFGVGLKFSKIAPSDLKEIVDYVNSVSRAVYVAP